MKRAILGLVVVGFFGAWSAPAEAGLIEVTVRSNTACGGPCATQVYLAPLADPDNIDVAKFNYGDFQLSISGLFQ